MVNLDRRENFIIIIYNTLIYIVFLNTDFTYKSLQTEFIIESRKTSFIACIYFIPSINNLKKTLLGDVSYIMPKNV